jgi:hypothetical protein
METWEILDKAADVIDECGHCRNGLAEDRDGHVCAMKAIAIAACYESPLTARAIDLFRETLDTQYVGRWNDEHTTDEVTSTMRAVAATLRAQRGDETPTVTQNEPAIDSTPNVALESHTA